MGRGGKKHTGKPSAQTTTKKERCDEETLGRKEETLRGRKERRKEGRKEGERKGDVVLSPAVRASVACFWTHAAGFTSFCRRRWASL